MPYPCDCVLEGAKIKAMREKHNLTQGQLAYLIGVRQQCISKYEARGCRNLWIIQRIATVFNEKT